MKTRYLAIVILIFLTSCGGSESPSWKDQLIAEWASENVTGGISFVGDSIIESWPAEYMPPGSHNRGISGNTTYDILDRTWLIIDEAPDEMYLMIGTNNLLQGYGSNSIVPGIKRIIDEVQVGSPDTVIHVMSVLPNTLFSTVTINSVNSQLVAMLSDYPDVEYIDLFDLFYDYENEQVINMIDGLHPADSGYILMYQSLF